ncbi:MSCRAMM family adhesin SdrC [Polaribacter sp.]|nr:MSCRAMM family adhesin SdrC [Polaribacter sp.]MDB9778114.1 MSCRAMM family adhesin SdrC [Polaribacter sp.]MDB9888116.1 MSCRAMM family adhesin SdrC [Polaribacter sp.]MDC1534466.1 MSCRAMM family adhesin SdrC [Polaribacter sp.]
MKKINVLSLILTFFLNSCLSVEEPNIIIPNFVETPEASELFNTSNFGIYKGVFVGSSGIVLINLNNNNTISASLTIDGVNYIFSTNESITENQQTEINFTNNDNYFVFNVSSTGTNPEITNLSIQGHPNAETILVKETSERLTKVFEGNYNGIDNDDAGVFNAIVSGSEMYVLAFSTMYSVFYTANGSVNNENITGVTSTGTNFTGIIENDKMNGSWNNSQSNENGNWNAERSY